VPKLADVWRRRAQELRRLPDEIKCAEAELWERAAEELERHHGRRLKHRSRYKRRETWPEI